MPPMAQNAMIKLPLTFAISVAAITNLSHPKLTSRILPEPGIRIPQRQRGGSLRLQARQR
jgi:hypothetical protein